MFFREATFSVVTLMLIGSCLDKNIKLLWSVLSGNTLNYSILELSHYICGNIFEAVLRLKFMTFRKWTSLLIMVGFMTSLFHSLAHARTPDIYAHSVMQLETVDSTDHGSEEIVSSHCDVCHVFASIFVIGQGDLRPVLIEKQKFNGFLSAPLPSDMPRLHRPPCLFV